MLGERGVAMRMASGGEVFFVNLYGRRLGLVVGCGFLGWRKVGWLRMFCWDCCAVKRMMG